MSSRRRSGTRPATGTAVLALLALPACALVSDLDHEPAADEASSSASAGSGGGGAGASAPTSSSTESTSATSTSTGGGSAPGAGGGGTTCTSDGHEDVPAWVAELPGVRGQHVGELTRVPPTAAALDGDRLVLAMAIGADVGPVGFDGGPSIHDGADGAVVVGTIDDDGTPGAFWTVAGVQPDPSFAPAIDVAVARPGVALVSIATEGATFELVEVDLCTGVATPIAACSGTSLAVAKVAAGSDGRVAFAFSAAGTPICELPDPCDPPEARDSVSDGYVYDWDPSTATCSSLRIHDPTETPASPSSQFVAGMAIDGDGLRITGMYGGRSDAEGAIFQGDLQKTTPQGSVRVYHARLERSVDGARLEPTAAYDLGQWIVLGAVDGVASGGRQFALATVEAGSRDKEFPDAPPEPTSLGGTDVLAMTIGDDGTRGFARRLGSASYDILYAAHASAGGVTASGVIGSAGPDLGFCDEPYFATDETGGCAFFADLADDGTVSASLVVDGDVEPAAGRPGDLDVGLASFRLPDGDWLVIGATTGSVDAFGAPTTTPADGTSTLYVARLPPR